MQRTPDCLPHSLPCSVDHDGPIEVHPRYWPTTKPQSNGKYEAYVRGRRLEGRKFTVAKNYEGVLGSVVPKRSNSQHDQETKAEGQPDLDTSIMQIQDAATFSEVILWDHEKEPGDDHVLAKGLQEWIDFATTMHNSDQAAVSDAA